MKTIDTWYDEVDPQQPITQGDIIMGCPVVCWKPESVRLERTLPIEAERLKAQIEAVSADVIVMTQACDLEQRKVTQVILCPHLSLDHWKVSVQEAAKQRDETLTSKKWQRLCDEVTMGFCWNLAMLDRRDVGTVHMEHRIVDFHEVFTLPRSVVELILAQRAEPRLRLRAPYREHLSQAFARFFMRVGLPTEVRRGW